jgi:hypothetical protein
MSSMVLLVDVLRGLVLWSFFNFVLSEMENGLQVDAVYTDFSKAFDIVNHG